MDKIARQEYTELQQGIDRLIGKFGMPKTLKIITQLSGSVAVRKQKDQREKLIATFVISESCKIFEVEDTEVKSKPSKRFKEARMACYYIINQYTQLSYNEIGSYFDQGKFGVYYHITKCKDALSIPKFNKSFVEKHEILDQSVLQFIAKID